jgi:RsiW-degrading membrane proteinase PrsW (M82 family)
MIGLYIIFALLIAWAWVDYFRLIDVYDKESIASLVFTFLLGGFSTQLVIWGNEYFLDGFHFVMNGNFLNDLLFCIFKIGLVEESLKALVIVFVFLSYGHKINEPVDYLVFFSLSALGFATVENIMYFNTYGISVISWRAILSTVGHMFFTSLIAYGFIRLRYFHAQQLKYFYIPLLYLLLAATMHGLYDFFLMWENPILNGFVLTVILFFLCISIFAIILNNSLNNSKFFTYKIVVDSSRVVKRMFIYYGIIFLFEFLLLFFNSGLTEALKELAFSFVFVGLITSISIVRLSRFKLIRNHWFKIKLELPFYFHKSDQMKHYRIRIKGEGYNEVHITKFFGESIWYTTFSGEKGIKRKVEIHRKVFHKHDQTFFIGKLYHSEESLVYETVLIKPKLEGESLVDKEHPIVAIFQVEDLQFRKGERFSASKTTFMHWAYLHH